MRFDLDDDDLDEDDEEEEEEENGKRDEDDDEDDDDDSEEEDEDEEEEETWQVSGDLRLTSAAHLPRLARFYSSSKGRDTEGLRVCRPGQSHDSSSTKASGSFAMRAASNISSTAARSEAPFSSCFVKDSGSSSRRRIPVKVRAPATFA